jgi:hypothetical protein
VLGSTGWVWEGWHGEAAVDTQGTNPYVLSFLFFNIADSTGV